MFRTNVLSVEAVRKICTISSFTAPLRRSFGIDSQSGGLILDVKIYLEP